MLCKQPEGYNKRGVNNLLDPPGHYITRVSRVNKLVLFILSTRPLTLLFWKEVLGEPLPYLRSTRSLTGAKSLYNKFSRFAKFRVKFSILALKAETKLWSCVGWVDKFHNNFTFLPSL